MSGTAPFGVGLVGCGLAGRKRADGLGPGGRLIACADTDMDRADSLAKQKGARPFIDWRQLLELPEVDIVIIATPHESLAAIATAALHAQKHVFVEKPAARSAAELEALIALAGQSDVKIRVGFNHRYHRAVQHAKRIIDSGALGELMFIRARYGHGGRPGYDKEWRADPGRSGGGELMDQGPHLIDLSRWFLGNFPEVSGSAHTYFWNMPVDDNAFMTLRTASQQTAFLHVSCTEWKNLFSMEIYGKSGKLDLFGLGGSYGTERLTWYKMLPEMGPPETASWEYPMADHSWAAELAEFYTDILKDRQPEPGLQDAYAALKIIEKIYKTSGYDHLT